MISQILRPLTNRTFEIMRMKLGLLAFGSKRVQKPFYLLQSNDGDVFEIRIGNESQLIVTQWSGQCRG